MKALLFKSFCGCLLFSSILVACTKEKIETIPSVRIDNLQVVKPANSEIAGEVVRATTNPRAVISKANQSHNSSTGE